MNYKRNHIKKIFNDIEYCRSKKTILIIYIGRDASLIFVKESYLVIVQFLKNKCGISPAKWPTAIFPTCWTHSEPHYFSNSVNNIKNPVKRCPIKRGPTSCLQSREIKCPVYHRWWAPTLIANLLYPARPFRSAIDWTRSTKRAGNKWRGGKKVARIFSAS